MNTSNRNTAPARGARPAAPAAPPARNGARQPVAPVRPAPRVAATPQEPEQAPENLYPIIEVTEAKAWPLANPTGKTLGFASVTLGGHIVVDDIRVVDGSKGLFIAMPERSYTDKDSVQQYKKIVKPISRDQLDAIQDAILEAWNSAVEGGSRA